MLEMTSPARASSTRAAGAAPAHATEILPGALYRLCSYVDLDGRITWAPKIPGWVQPVGCYIIRDTNDNYLIDSGLAGHRAEIVAQAEVVLPRGLPLTCVLTRTEYQCVGNLGAIFRARGLDRLVSGGRNPFAAYEDVARELKASVPRIVLDLVGEKIRVADAENLFLIPPLIRLLSTNWLYDVRLKTLFSSDFFGHTSTERPQAVISSLNDDRTTLESARQHIMCRYFWLEYATTRPLIAWLEKVFADHDIENIAPTFGCVLKGREVVGKHYSIVMDILKTAGR